MHGFPNSPHLRRFPYSSMALTLHRTPVFPSFPSPPFPSTHPPPPTFLAGPHIPLPPSTWAFPLATWLPRDHVSPPLSPMPPFPIYIPQRLSVFPSYPLMPFPTSTMSSTFHFVVNDLVGSWVL
jgi:hypothetical protein